MSTSRSARPAVPGLLALARGATALCWAVGALLGLTGVLLLWFESSDDFFLPFGLWLLGVGLVPFTLACLFEVVVAQTRAIDAEDGSGSDAPPAEPPFRFVERGTGREVVD